MYGNYNGLYGVNPYQNQLQQNRFAQTEQYGGGYGYTPNNYQVQNVTQQTLKGRPVSSFDEAKASMIDLDGSLFVFTDIANNKIYTKQILLDGSAELKIYSLESPIKQKQTNEDYVLRKDFESVVNELLQKIEQLKGGLVNE